MADKSVVAVVTFDVSHFRQWYKVFEELESEGVFAKEFSIASTFVGESRRTVAGRFLSSTQASAHVVHVFPRESLDAVRAAYVGDKSEKLAKWKKLRTSPVVFACGEISFQDDAHDLADAEVMTTFVSKDVSPAFFSDFTVSIGDKDDDAPTKTLVARGIVPDPVDGEDNKEELKNEDDDVLGDFALTVYLSPRPLEQLSKGPDDPAPHALTTSELLFKRG